MAAGHRGEILEPDLECESAGDQPGPAHPGGEPIRLTEQLGAALPQTSQVTVVGLLDRDRSRLCRTAQRAIVGAPRQGMKQ